jgi:hypothetical protein
MAFPVVPVIGGAMTLAGALMGRNSDRPTIDPEMLNRLFGPQALAGDTGALFRMLLNSPAFTQIMRSANLQGSRLGSDIQANVARAGMGGSPLGAFARSAARGYGSALQTPAMGGLYMQALQAALSNLNMRAGLWGQSQLGRQEDPTFQRMLASSLTSAGATGLLGWKK